MASINAEKSQRNSLFTICKQQKSLWGIAKRDKFQSDSEDMGYKLK